MSDVTLKVGGRKYTVACQDGQEAHIERLAGMVDNKLSTMGANLSSQEAKNLLFAALLLADELDEAQSAPPPPPQSAPRRKGKSIPRSPKRSKRWPNGWKNRPPCLRVRARTPR